jgi:hypothetical protein
MLEEIGMTQNTPAASNKFIRTDCLFKSEKYHVSNQKSPVGSHQMANSFLFCAHKLYQESNLNDWLASVVNFLNQFDGQTFEFPALFHQWTAEERQFALRHASSPELVHCINAIFFYKLYPDKLFDELIHPEKLVSVRMRLGVLHLFMEEIQNQLVHFALPHGLKPELDYLFHGDNLPQGIMIEVDEAVRCLIRTAVTHLKVKFTPENETEVALDRLHDLGRAYKYWFNPNRLIDAAMVLKQHLVKDKTIEKNDFQVFQMEMVNLYGQFTTSECLDLYGYFSNKDSCYLLHTLRIIIEGSSFDWLHKLNKDENNAITTVLQALQCVFEALRVELKNRNISTESYSTNASKKFMHVGKRNREAVHRIIAIYAEESVSSNGGIEKLFNLIEGKES